MYFTLAWRNIWRNKRRSFITLASICLAVLLSLYMRSMQLGFYAKSIDNAVSFFTGYIQVHKDGYWDKQTIDRSFGDVSQLTEKVSQVEHVTNVAPRIESFTLLSAGDKTEGGMVIGVHPDAEIAMSRIGEKISVGRFLKNDDTGIVIGAGLAKNLQVSVGDTLVVLGQGYHGIMAADRFPVLGLIDYPMPELNNRMAYLTLPVAQNLYGAPDRATSLAIMIENEDVLHSIHADLRGMLGDAYEVMDWRELMPELVQGIETDNASGLIMLGIVYMVITFGIFGTILMMTLERTREFGMLMAVGMQRSKMILMTVIESLLLCLIGVASGLLGGWPIVFYFHLHPIPLTGDTAQAVIEYGFEPVMPFSLDPMLFVNQGLVVMTIALVVSMYPALKLSRLNTIEAMRGTN